MQSKADIREQVYLGHNEQYLYDGFTAEQWWQIAIEHDTPEYWRIIEVLDDMGKEC